MVVARTSFHVAEEKEKEQSKLFLMATIQPDSPLSKLRGVSNTLELIFDYSRSQPSEGDFYYKMGIVMCAGTEHVHMERLVNPEGDNGFGSLTNNTINGASWFMTKKFLKEYAWGKNDDGSFLNEGQLRQLWNQFVVPRYCGQSESPHGGRCKGCCAALLGDTVYWRANDLGYPESYKYEPATQEDLVERGYITTENGYTSVLTQQAKLARDDPSQLSESDDED
jgi:hypothetical protein